MKLSPWQFIAAIAVLMTAVICAHVFAPGASATVVSMVTTLFALFVQRQEAEAPKPNPEMKPELEVIDGGKQ